MVQDKDQLVKDILRVSNIIHQNTVSKPTYALVPIEDSTGLRKDAKRSTKTENTPTGDSDTP